MQQRVAPNQHRPPQHVFESLQEFVTKLTAIVATRSQRPSSGSAKFFLREFRGEKSVGRADSFGMRIAAAALLLAFQALGQNLPSTKGFRLGYTQSIYIESLGADDAAKFVRDQLTGALLNRTHIAVENDRQRADALLVGTAIVTSGFQSWAVGSSSSGAAASAASSNGSMAAAAVTSAATFSSAGGTVRITELGLQLTDRDGRVLWAYDRSRCLDAATLVLVGIPKNKPTTVCAAEQLAKAIDKDAKSARTGASSGRVR